jgi:serine/threonine protein phosphatase 1
MKKIYAIGDIHGCLENLTQLLNRIDIDKQNDTLVFIGDYIDRGKYSREVVDYVIRLQDEYKNIICLLGNHEQMFLNYLEGVDESLYLANGGKANLDSYGILLSDDVEQRKAKLPDKYRKFFQSLLPYYETDKYIFVHAGLRPGLPLKDQTLDDLLWIRYEFIDSKNDFGKTVIFGHTSFMNPLMDINKIGIDTGSVYGGNLTCVELPELKIYQA